MTVDDLMLLGGEPKNRWTNGPSDFHAGRYRKVLLREPCVYCLGTASGMDHIRPRSSFKMGAPFSRKQRKWGNSWENRAPACRACDSSKGAKSLLLYLVTRVPAPTPEASHR